METAQRVKFFFLIEESFIGNGEDKSSFFLKKFEFGGVGVGFRADGAMLVPVLVLETPKEFAHHGGQAEQGATLWGEPRMTQIMGSKPEIRNKFELTNGRNDRNETQQAELFRVPRGGNRVSQTTAFPNKYLFSVASAAIRSATTPTVGGTGILLATGRIRPLCGPVGAGGRLACPFCSAS